VNRVLLGTALVALAAALFGTLSYITRNADAVGMDALVFVAWRGAIATIALLVAGMLFARGGSAARVGFRDLPSRGRWTLIVACLLGALLNIAMFAAFLRTTVAVALICFYSFPTLVTLGAVSLYGERLDRIRISALVLSWIGLILVVLAPALFSGSGLTIEPTGVGLAFFAAGCQAAFVLIAGRGFAPLPSSRVATYAVFAAGAVALLLALLAGNITGLLVPLHESRAWIWIVAGGVTGAAIPTTAFIAGIGLIGPSRAAILMTIEPIVGVGLAALLLGETPSLIQLLGGAAVLVAAAVLQVAPRTKAPIEPEYAPLV
jgi:drug/metabolite transporter (DMT)-like permease